MEKEIRTVQINTKGRMNRHVIGFLAKLKAVHLGVKAHEFVLDDQNARFVLSGQREKVWKMVDWAKKSRFFYIVSEVDFQFVDADVS